MKGLAKENFSRPILMGILLLLIVQSITIPYPSFSQQTQEVKVYTSPVSYPLPTVPEPVTVGSPLRVNVEAGSGAGGWAVRLVSDYGSSLLTIINSSYTGAAGWTLFFEVPASLRSGLYSLNIAYSAGGSTINYTQSRSVWILNEWPERLKISQITDIHLPEGANLFATYVYETNLIQPDIVVGTGDIVDQESIASAWVYLQRILDRLKVPSYFLPGNHDHSGARGANYQLYCGQLNYSVCIGNFLFIALDTAELGYLTSGQLQWAEKVLQRYPNKVKIMSFHHPFFGSETGGNITGSWTEIEKLKDYMYYSWTEQLSEARELLRLIEQYDIRLILSGHVHRDIVYLYNNRHYFVTTCTLGGSYPQGFYASSRLIEIDVKGNIKLDAYAEKRIFNPPNAIPVGNVIYYYRSANNGSETAVSATIINRLEQKLTGVKLEFYVNPKYSVNDYAFYSTKPTRSETLSTKKGYLFITHVDVPPRSILHLTLAATKDVEGPRIRTEILGEIKEEKPIPLKIEVADAGWGVRDVEVSYSTDKGTPWTKMDLPLTMRVNRDESVLQYPIVEYAVSIPGQVSGTKLMVEVKALDFANNSKTYQATYAIGPPTYTLRVESSPVVGVPFTLDGQGKTTLYSAVLKTGNYTVVLSTEVTVAGTTYNFVRWGDGLTTTTRTINLKGDTTLTIYYEVKAGMPLWQISAIAAVVIAIVAITLLRMRKII